MTTAKTKSKQEIPVPPEQDDAPEPEVPDDLPFPLESATRAQDELKILIHGDPGVGKTWLAGTAADSKAMSPVLFVDTEGGTLTIRSKVKNGVLDIVRVTIYSDMV